MNRPDTARMAQSPHDDIIELIEIVREDEEKTAEADSDSGQDADIIELDDAIEDFPQEESLVTPVGSGSAGGRPLLAAPADAASEEPAGTSSPADETAVMPEETGSVQVACPPPAADLPEDVTAALETAVSAPVASRTEDGAGFSAEEQTLLLERIHTLEENLAQAVRENDEFRLRLEDLEQRMAEWLGRLERELVLLEDRTAALEAVPQISLDSVQAAMDSLSGQLNASLDAMQGNLDAVQRELHADETLTELSSRLEPTIDKAAAQAAARVIREEISRMMAQA